MSPLSFAAVIDALCIPPQALIAQRVPKKMLLEHGAPTAADKRQIQDGIGEIVWVAALKPTNIGVPDFQDESRQYAEIAILTVELRPAAKPARLIELIHRAIPYPLVLITGHSEGVSLPVTLSAAHKRWSQGEAGKVVLEEVRQIALSPGLNSGAPSTPEAAFLASLAVSRLPARDLFRMYQGVLASVAALEAARITGEFAAPESLERASAMREGLDQYARLKRDLELLRVRAGKEKQINRRVDLNLDIQRIQAELAAIQSGLLKETKVCRD
jgi:hypothetical protein